ncbi:MAP9 protein, partial [Glareola pratincola]|nr:MAP9 protein [Glareola pratincola]
PLDQDEKNSSTSDLKLEDSSRECPSVTEAGMTTAYEKTKKLEKSTDDISDETVKITEEQIVTDTIQKVSVNDQSECGEAKNISKDSVKVLFVCIFTIVSLSSARLKKNAKAVPSATPISSQYLGTLKVLEDKRVRSNSTEFDKADSLRAAVFQNWLEKKRPFLLELKRTEKKKAEDLRNNAEKKEAIKREEAIASFEAWKKKKGREAKKLSEKKKVEELRKKKAAEQNEQRTEEAQKVVHRCSVMISCSSLSLCRNEKKEEYMKQKKVEKILERRRQEIQQAKKEEKDKKAMEEYERWLEKKEKREQLEKQQKKLQAVRGDEVPSPWSPPGKVTYSMNY